MKSFTDLKNILSAIDHRGYPAYKDCLGKYAFDNYILSIDHVQGDPFAAPSKVSVLVPRKTANFPTELLDTHAKKVTLQDHLTRLFSSYIESYSFKAKGSGKSGLISCSHCGQEVLERTACKIDDNYITMRFEVGFPANGRSINSKELIKVFYQFLPECIQHSLYWDAIDHKKVFEAIRLCEDQEYIRSKLPELGLCAFIGNGSILPRATGVSCRPMKDATLFQSPPSLEITLKLPNHGNLSGMGIKKGVTLFVGGGYHGKSTLLKALELGVYNHIARDGREYVITDASALKLRAEDGRSISNVDISAFINHLPNKIDTTHFSTTDASGSTSQAAGLIEGIESGSHLLLIDEDTSATNFMIRDELMQQVIAKEEEPITPFIERVRSLYEDWNVSSILVAGSSGSYFHVADTIIQMKDYVPIDITTIAKEAATHYPAILTSANSKKPVFSRFPQANPTLKNTDRIKLKLLGTSGFVLARETIELRFLEQLIDNEQTAALAYLLKYALKNIFNGSRSMIDAVDELESLMDNQGLERICDNLNCPVFLARPRRQEIFSCFNRYRDLF